MPKRPPQTVAQEGNYRLLSYFQRCGGGSGSGGGFSVKGFANSLSAAAVAVYENNRRLTRSKTTKAETN
ncbi:hypothetical protein M0802_005052 [Mischocyttarus mexicanus]|nr:hypothetical protein M0802_005052 [Mischocyttarus mexicanus]